MKDQCEVFKFSDENVKVESAKGGTLQWWT